MAQKGRVIAVDIQAKMLEVLERRARKAGLSGRIETRLAKAGSMDTGDLKDAVDFALAFAMVHEVPSPAEFFAAMATALKPRQILFFAEPVGHVSGEDFNHELEVAQRAGFEIAARPRVRRSQAVALRKC